MGGVVVGRSIPCFRDVVQFGSACLLTFEPTYGSIQQMGGSNMSAAKTELRNECVRLRVEERLSYRDIQVRTGASKGSLSGWLKGHPLTDEEKSASLRRNGPAWNKGMRKYKIGESAISRMTRCSHLDGNQKSKVAEAAVLLRLCANGCSVYGSPFDGDASDWVVQTPRGRLFRVQVKLAFRAGQGMPVVNLRTSGSKRKYKKEECDFMVGYDLHADEAHVFSWDDIRGYSSAVSASDESREAWDKVLRV